MNSLSIKEELLCKSQTVEVEEATNKITRTKKEVIISIILSQILAVIAVLNGLASTIIENNYRLSFPITLSMLYYFVLFLVYLFVVKTPKRPKLVFAIIALFESQGNCINIYAFTKLRFSYPFIINICGYFWTLLISRIFIKQYRYTYHHAIGIGISILGISSCVYGIIKFSNETNSEESSFSFFGMLLCILSSLLYSASALIQESVVEPQEISEYLMWMGLFSFLILGAEGFIFNEFQEMVWFLTSYSDFDVKLVFLLIMFLVTLLIFTSAVPYFLKKYSAALFNIGLVVQIIWSYIFDIFLGKPLVSIEFIINKLRSTMSGFI